MIRWLWALPLGAFPLLAGAVPVLSYLAAHPGALGAESAALLLDHALDLLFALLLFLGLAALGRRALERLGPPGLPRGEAFLASIMLGEGLLATALMLAGHAGFFSPGLLQTVFLPLVVAGLLEARRLYGVRLKAPSRLELAAAAALLAGFGALAAKACAPPTDFDTLVYHLAFPKIFLARGTIAPESSALFGFYALNSQMLGAIALAVRGELAAQWLNLGHAALYLGWTAAIARRLRPGAAWLALPALAVQPVFQRVGSGAASDFAASAQILGAFWFFMNARDNARPARWSLLAGMIAGFAAGTKQTGAWAVLLLGAGHLATPGLRRAAPVYIAAASLCGAPWYLRNLLWTGNPVWPYMATLFGGGQAALDTWARVRASVTEGVPRTALNLLLLPVLLVVKPAAFLYEPQWLMGSVWALIGLRWRALDARARLALLLAGGYALLWFLVYQHWRFMLPAAALLAAVAASCALELWSRPGGRLVAALAGLLVFFPLARLGRGNELFGALGLRSAVAPERSSRDRYLDLALGPYYELCRRANALVPPDGKILLYRDARGYYLDREYAWGNPHDPGVVDYAAYANESELAAALREKGITHILFNPRLGIPAGDHHYYARAEMTMRELLVTEATPVAELGGLGLYDLRESTSSRFESAE